MREEDREAQAVVMDVVKAEAKAGSRWVGEVLLFTRMAVLKVEGEEDGDVIVAEFDGNRVWKAKK